MAFGAVPQNYADVKVQSNQFTAFTGLSVPHYIQQWPHAFITALDAKFIANNPASPLHPYTPSPKLQADLAFFCKFMDAIVARMANPEFLVSNFGDAQNKLLDQAVAEVKAFKIANHLSDAESCSRYLMAWLIKELLNTKTKNQKRLAKSGNQKINHAALLQTHLHDSYFIDSLLSMLSQQVTATQNIDLLICSTQQQDEDAFNTLELIQNIYYALQNYLRNELNKVLGYQFTFDNWPQLLPKNFLKLSDHTNALVTQFTPNLQNAFAQLEINPVKTAKVKACQEAFSLMCALATTATSNVDSATKRVQLNTLLYNFSACLELEINTVMQNKSIQCLINKSDRIIHTTYMQNNATSPDNVKAQKFHYSAFKKLREYSSRFSLFNETATESNIKTELIQNLRKLNATQYPQLDSAEAVPNPLRAKSIALQTKINDYITRLAPATERSNFYRYFLKFFVGEVGLIVTLREIQIKLNRAIAQPAIT